MFFQNVILLSTFVSLLILNNVASSSWAIPFDQNGNFYEENEIEDSDFGPKKTSSESTATTVAQFRSLVDPGDRYGDVWEAVGRGARSK